MGFLIGLVFAFLFYIAAKSVYVLDEGHAGILERMGKYRATLGPGFHVTVPLIDRVAFIQDLREQPVDVPPQRGTTRDGAEIIVEGNIYMAVRDAFKASYGVANCRRAVAECAQATIRSTVGQVTLADTRSKRRAIGEQVAQEANDVASTWGVEITRYEIDNVKLVQHAAPATASDEAERSRSAEAAAPLEARDAPASSRPAIDGVRFGEKYPTTN